MDYELFHKTSKRHGIDDIAWCNTESGQVGAWLVKTGDEGRTIEWQPIATVS